MEKLISKLGFLRHMKSYFEKEVDLDDMWATVPGSHEQYRSMIYHSLRDIAESDDKTFGEIDWEWDLGLEAVLGDFPYKVIITNYEEGKYYQADVTLNDTSDGVDFSNIGEVELQVALASKNESRKKEVQHRKKLEKAGKKSGEFISFRDNIDATVTLTDTRTGSVEIAQEADTKNYNDRIYPKDVLTEAVERAQTHIEEYGPLLMDSQHRVEQNGNTDLRETVALIKEIEFDDSDGVVKLPEIVFIDTQAGQDVLAFLDGGGKLQVSQRGYGTSHVEIDEKTGERTEIVDYLIIDGFDFIPKGEAAVEKAHFTLNAKTKTAETKDDESEETANKSEKNGDSEMEMTDEQKALLEAIKGLGDLSTLKEDITKAVVTELASKETEEDEVTKAEETKKLEETKKNEEALAKLEAEKNEKAKAEETKKEESKKSVEEKTETDKLIESLRSEIKQSTDDRKEFQEMKDREHLRNSGDKVISEKVETYERFNDSQKNLIRDHVKAENYYGQIEDVRDAEAVKTVLETAVQAKADEVDQFIATMKLESLGYNKGITNVDIETKVRTRITDDKSYMEAVVNRNLPDAEMRAEIHDVVIDKLKELKPNLELLPEDHASMKSLGKMLDINYRNTHTNIMNEAQLVQGDIGGRINSINPVLIGIAWRMITAVPYCMTGTQERIIDDIKIAKLDPTNLPDGDGIERDIADQFGDLEVAEDGTIGRTKVEYLNFPVYASRQALRATITPHAIATARGTPMDPVTDTLAALTLDIANRFDRMLWQLHITRAMERTAVGVTSWETLTRVPGTTNEWKSVNPGWLQYQWVKTANTQGNPNSAKFHKMAPDSGDSDARSSLTLQGVTLQTDASTPVDLDSITDYTVNYPEGSITLTAAGETKRADANVQARYTYSPNIVTWNAVPAPGLNQFTNLLNLRRAVGLARLKVTDQNYMPSFIATNDNIADLITNGPQFTNDGGNPADMLDRMNNIMRYRGMDLAETSAIQQPYIIVSQQGSVYHRVHTPWAMEPVEVNESTGNKTWIGGQFTASDMPVAEKTAIIAIQGLNKVE